MQNSPFKNILTFYFTFNNSLIKNHFSNNPYTNVFGLARTFLAISLLVTLIFNPIDNLFLSIGHDTANSILKIDSNYNKINFFLLIGFKNLYIMYYLAILFLLTVAIGFSPRFTCMIHWWIQFSFINSSSTVDGGDQIASNLLLMLVPICLLDNRIWHWKSMELSAINEYKLIFCNVIHKIIRVQMAVIYFHSAVGKFKVKEWEDGTALYYWLNDPFFKMPTWIEPFMNSFLSHPLIIVCITWSAILFELILFTGVFMDKKHRKYLLIFGVIFHLLILFLFGLVSFFFSITAGLILYLKDSNKPLILKFR